MSDLRDVVESHRFEQGFTDAQGGLRRVWADYADQNGVRALLHVEADEALRGSGAAGRFMQALTIYARAQGLKLRPVCDYAVVWFKRHPETHDVLA